MIRSVLLASVQRLLARLNRILNDPAPVEAPVIVSPPPFLVVNESDSAVAQALHDIANQLSVIEGCTETIRRLMPENSSNLELNQLRDCVSRASELTSDILRSGSASESRHAIDLNTVAMHVGAILSSYVNRRVTLRVRISLDVIPVLAYPAELERIVLNLALNAVEAILDVGTITIETQVPPAASLPAEAGTNQRYAKLIVSDTGSGMTTEVRSRLFEPFFTTKQNGLGLGLPSVAHTVRQLGGRIVVESQPGGGTSIAVYLPCLPDASLRRSD
jgi:signal transduction histidine kinase